MDFMTRNQIESTRTQVISKYFRLEAEHLWVWNVSILLSCCSESWTETQNICRCVLPSYFRTTVEDFSLTLLTELPLAMKKGLIKTYLQEVNKKENSILSTGQVNVSPWPLSRRSQGSRAV
jgi:hypothetical protein